MKTLIVGGGLSGLALAENLETQGREYLLVEARSRFGGRIFTHLDGDGYFDMGPAWFWPGQPRIAALIARLNLEKFDQFTQGSLIFEDEQGRAQRGKAFLSMQGSWRLMGGLGALINTLANRIPDDRKYLNAEVTHLEMLNDCCVARLSHGQEISADHVVLALPPRIAAQIDFSPALPANAVQAMRDIAFKVGKYGGLTPKHVDAAELMRVLDARPVVEPRIAPVEVSPGVHRFTPDVVDFALTVVEAGSAVGGIALETNGPAIVLCLDGELTLQGELVLERGQAAFCDDEALSIHGDGRLVIATGEHPDTVEL
jgi:hypothetical protein